MLALYPRRIGIWSVGFCGGRKTGEPGENPSEQGREPTTTQHTYDTGSGNCTWATLVGGERLTTAPSLLPKDLLKVTTRKGCHSMGHIFPCMTSINWLIDWLVLIWKVRHYCISGTLQSNKINKHARTLMNLINMHSTCISIKLQDTLTRKTMSYYFSIVHSTYPIKIMDHFTLLLNLQWRVV